MPSPRWLVVYAAVGLALVSCSPAPPPAPKVATVELKNLSAAEIEVIKQIVLNAFSGTERSVVHKPILESSDPVYVALRANGVKISDAWTVGTPVRDSLKRAVAIAVQQPSPDELPAVDTIEVCLTHSLRPVTHVPSELRDKDRGILGVSVKSGTTTRWMSPTEIVARNLKFERAIAEMLRSTEAQITTFDAVQLLIDVKGATAVQMVRGNTPVAQSAVTKTSVRALSDGLSLWLTSNARDDGSIPYKYWPSRGEFSDENNIIRQLLATIAMQRWAAATNGPVTTDLAKRNLAYNIANYFRIDKDLGLIWDADRAKLGAIALAALAIVESPDRESYREQEQALLRTVDSLWRDTGAFQSYVKPADLNDNQNFYPGEALLLWAVLYEKTSDEQLLARFMKSFDYYREWHRKNRNPAFVPWHTQAYALVLKKTHDTALQSFIFEMNDWLVTTQQRDNAPYSDMAGRFYDPDFPGYGPPHASSTGVYLEGLIAAYEVAEQANDRARAATYRTAILSGIRNVIQLQFQDNVDLYYVSKRDRVLGGIRTTEYNNEIRIDNVAHNLLAVSSLGNAPDTFFALPAESGSH